MRFAICYKSGSVAWPQLCSTRRQAKRVIASMPELADVLHVVDTEAR